MISNKRTERREAAYDQEVVGLNPDTIYWMGVNDNASYYIEEKWKIKEA